MRKLLWLICLFVVMLSVTACGGPYKDNPLGYNHVRTLNSTATAIQVPSTTAQDVEHLRSPGLGSTPDTFAAAYGSPLPSSQPPTMYVFRAGLDDFPAGSILIVSFDKGKIDAAPRAVQISFVAGNSHPTTYNQAQAIAEGFFPDDTGQASVLQKNADYKCLVKGYQSPTMAGVFPKEAFLAQDGGVAKEGSIAVSFFPLYPRDGTGEDVYESATASEHEVSSVLIVLGSRPYC